MYGDGGNLWLSVTNDGSGKSWVFRWTVPGTRRERVMGLGPAHTVDLDEAREKARECRKLLLAGKDPLIERDSARLDRDIAAGLAKTVNEVVDEYWNAKIAHKSSHYISQSTWMLGKYVREPIGTMPIQKVNTNTILNQVGLRKLWTEQHPTAVILHSHLKRMFSLAIANKYYRGDNPAAWVGHLEHILPRSKDVHRAEHHSWVPYQDIGRFMAKLRAWEDQSCSPDRSHHSGPPARIRGVDRRAGLRGAVGNMERVRPRAPDLERAAGEAEDGALERPSETSADYATHAGGAEGDEAAAQG